MADFRVTVYMREKISRQGVKSGSFRPVIPNAGTEKTFSQVYKNSFQLSVISERRNE